MAYIAGSVRECSINNRIFQCPADAAVKVMLGGRSNEVQPTGSGKAIVVQTAVAAGIEGLTVAIDNDSDDLSFLQGIADAGAFVPITVTMADQNTYTGSLVITEPPAYDSSKGTSELKLAGQDKITLQ